MLTEYLGLKITKELLRAIQVEARRQRRSMSDTVRLVLEDVLLDDNQLMDEPTHYRRIETPQCDQ